MLSPQQLDKIGATAAAAFDPLIEAIAKDVARRIIGADFRITDTAAWQIERSRILGVSTEELMRQIQALYPAAEAQIAQVFTEAINKANAQDASLYAQAGLTQPTVSSSPQLQALVVSGWERTAGTLRNLTQTSAIGANSLLSATLQNQLAEVLDLAHMQITSGAFSYDQVIRQAIAKLADAGIGAITYPSGHRDTLEVAVRRAVLTGVNQTSGNIGLHNAQTLGTDLMEITAHPGARPCHAEWQGKLVSLSGRRGYLSTADIGYGTVTGFQGANCRHNWYPFFEGVSEPNWSAKKLAFYENQKLTYNGKTMSYYDATQAQRALERRVRKYKTRYLMQQQAAQNAPDEATRAMLEAAQRTTAKKLAGSRERLADFLQQTGLAKQQIRETVPGFGRSEAASAAAAARK